MLFGLLEQNLLDLYLQHVLIKIYFKKIKINRLIRELNLRPTYMRWTIECKCKKPIFSINLYVLYCSVEYYKQAKRPTWPRFETIMILVFGNLVVSGVSPVFTWQATIVPYTIPSSVNMCNVHDRRAIALKVA